MSEKRNFIQTLPPVQQTPGGQSQAGGSPLAGLPGYAGTVPRRPWSPGMVSGTGSAPLQEGWGCCPCKDCQPQKGFSTPPVSWLGVMQATSTPLISLFPWLGWGGPARRAPGSSAHPSPGARCKVGAGGQRLLGAGRKAQRGARPGSGAPCPTPAPALPPDAEGHD